MAVVAGGRDRRRAGASRSIRRCRPTQRVSGVSGSLNSVGSDTMNNMMTLWAETFRKFYPNVKIQVEGQGIVDGSAGADRRHVAVRSDVAADARDRDRPVRGEVRLQADRAEDQLRRARGLREQGQPDREADARAGRGDLQQEPQARLQAEHHDLGTARASPATGRTGRSASTAATPPAAPTASSRSTRSRTATTRTP